MTILERLFNSPFEALAIIFALVAAITVHEFAHAWTAARLGDETPVLDGRVSLNPAAHLDPLGSLSLLLFGFGWGRPVIINPMRLPKQVHELYVAMAGPGSNIILAFLLNLIAWGLASAGQAPNLDLLHLVADINVLLAAFNLLPIPPLDGSSIVSYFYPPYRSLVGGQIGLIILLALIFLPFGGASLLGTVLAPVISVLGQLASLFGILR